LRLLPLFGEILQKFVQDTPVTVMVRATLERLFNPEKLDAWFEATRDQQSTRTLLFSSLVGLMLQVVCRTPPSVNAVYRRSAITTSIVSVYAKLKDLSASVADAMTIAELYRTRWDTETAFQKLEQHIHSETQTLGYPQAALFGFCLALVALNLYAFVMAALRAAHPTEETDRTLSE
jgi:hypothetical protein